MLSDQARQLAIPDLIKAVAVLNETQVGRQALTDFLQFLDRAGLSLDARGQRAIETLWTGTQAGYCGTTLDLMREAIQ